MTREEYVIINQLLDEGKIDELRDYLDKVRRKQMINPDEVIERKGIKSVRKALMKFINENSDKTYPSYYARTKYHASVVKTYKGFYNKIENGFIISNTCNAFMLYDRSILTPDMEEMLEASYFKHSRDVIEKQKKSIITGFDRISRDNNLFTLGLRATIDGDFVDVQSIDVLSATVPANYYNIARKLLGKDTKEFVYEMGVYFESDSGKALVMKVNEKKLRR